MFVFPCQMGFSFSVLKIRTFTSQHQLIIGKGKIFPNLFSILVRIENRLLNYTNYTYFRQSCKLLTTFSVKYRDFSMQFET
jgi:hypothetical protein